MENEVFDDLVVSLNQALEYAKGDKTKGRKMVVNMSEDEIERRQLVFQKFESLPEPKKQRAILYVDELLGA